MKFSSSQKLLALTLSVFLVLPTLARTSTAPTKSRSTLREVTTPDATYFMNGNQVLAKTTKQGFSVYIYDKGRLSKIAHADGHFTKYHYENGRLDRITFSDGTVQKAIYGAGVLQVIESSSGQRLGLALGSGRVDKALASSINNDGQAVRAKTSHHLMEKATPAEQGTPLSLEKTTSAERINSLNRKLIAIETWEVNAWQCSTTPEGIQVCTGRPDPDEGGGGGGGGGTEAPYDPDPSPPENLPGDSGGGGGGPEPVPTNKPTQESCLQAAYNTWIIMRDEFCPMVSNQQLCLQVNYKLFQELREQCKVMYP